MYIKIHACLLAKPQLHAQSTANPASNMFALAKLVVLHAAQQDL